MRQDLAAGRPVVFTLDGPRGPARVAQPGAVWLASATRQPILPFHIEADRFWTARSWDRTQIPKPFSTVAVVIGQPMEVSSSEVEESGRAGGENERIQQGRSDLERSLEALETRAHSVLRANRQIA
jgi:hypothetical protein